MSAWAWGPGDLDPIGLVPALVWPAESGREPLRCHGHELPGGDRHTCGDLCTTNSCCPVRAISLVTDGGDVVASWRTRERVRDVRARAIAAGACPGDLLVGPRQEVLSAF